MTTVRCKEWLEADPARSQRFLDWIAGYYGALVGSTIYDSEIRAANEAHLRDVCAINPDLAVMTVMEMELTRGAFEPPRATIKREPKPPTTTP